MMYSVVTGGAGFIGSHLVDALVAQGDEVLVIDDCSAGSPENLAAHLENRRVRFIRMNLLDEGWQEDLRGADRLCHIAADPDVRASATSPGRQVRNNILATSRVLEAMVETDVPEILFTSTSTVYGDAAVIPTPEDYTPLEPISVYGATKLACEALISAFCYSFGMRAWVYRFANIVGARSNHGVIWDFVHKLHENPGELEILGDGRQAKSYLGVEACVDAMLFAADHADERFNVFNIGSDDRIDVVRIADIVCEEMGLSDVRYRFTGGHRGWVGDVPLMQLAVDRIRALGWKPGIGSEESVRRAARAVAEQVVHGR